MRHNSISCLLLELHFYLVKMHTLSLHFSARGKNCVATIGVLRFWCAQFRLCTLFNLGVLRMKNLKKPSLILAEIGFPMRWFRFIIYIQLFLAALVWFGNANKYLTGSYLGEYLEVVYGTFPWLKTVDICYACANFILAGYCIFVRQHLATFKKHAVLEYLSIPVAAIIIPLAYNIIISVLSDTNNVDSVAFIIQVVVITVYTVLNYVYFDKRKELFIY